MFLLYAYVCILYLLSACVYADDKFRPGLQPPRHHTQPQRLQRQETAQGRCQGGEYTIVYIYIVYYIELLQYLIYSALGYRCVLYIRI